ncbi:hypothetical protein HanRHA438_Chr14g0648951 [Helianthus annuus]|nr:hypothetical protein HanRHA438_Chr14g0648951 [Helianthus annuus]
MGPQVLLGGAFDDPDDCTRQPACNTGVGVRAIHYWTKDLLTRRQDYEIANGGFGRGQVKPLSDATAEKGGGEQGTGGEASSVDEWLQELAALRSKIEKTFSDRLNLEPDNKDHRRLKRKYLEVLDVLPCLPDEGLETFEEGDMWKRTAGGSSSPPSALAVGLEQLAQDDSDAASDFGDKHEDVDLNVLISSITETAVEGGGISLGDVAWSLTPIQVKKEIKKHSTPPPSNFFLMQLCLTEKNVFFFLFILGTHGAAGGGDVDDGADGMPDVGNVGVVPTGSGDAEHKEAESLQGVIYGEEQLSVETQGTVSLGDNSQVDASGPVETRVGGSDVERPANVGKSGNEKGPMNARYVTDG